MRLCAHYCTNPECTVGAHSLPAMHAKPSANKPYICEQFEAVYPKLLFLAIFMQYAQLTWRGATSRTGGSAQESPSFATSTFSATVPVFATENGARRCPSRPSPRRGRAACATENGVRRWRRRALSVERALRAAKTARALRQAAANFLRGCRLVEVPARGLVERAHDLAHVLAGGGTNLSDGLFDELHERLARKLRRQQAF